VLLSHEDILSSEMSCLRGEVHGRRLVHRRSVPSSR
jgi:hypothetical protein